ncbi:MAG TPA: HlyD family efflux transporter periplasmic adaptor subunit [Vicinamibacterales bacterium]|nr:HlyD family efflux transporter periplasmic adaptor subunit [Vicinamibacterales bacterium]
MVDIARDPQILKRKRQRQIAMGIATLLVVVAVSVFLAGMEPAAPTVDRGTVLTDSVKRGSLISQVRGVGTLVPEDTRWIPAVTQGKVERILLRPGAEVTANSVILELSNPQVEQDASAARLALQSAEATLANLRVQLRNERLTQEATVAGIESDYTQARLDAEAKEALAKDGLASALELKQAQIKAATLKKRLDIENKRLASFDESNDARMSVQEAAVDTAREVLELQESRLASLKVRPGFDGELQQVPVEVGQQVSPGTNLARVANPMQLKAELRVAETSAKDIEIGQLADIDTRSSIIKGRVSRKDPAAANGSVIVDVSLTEALPRGAVPDLSVDGTIQLQRLDNVLYVARPSLGQDHSTIGLFKLRPDGSGDADRVQVKLGLSSVNAVEIVSGLKEGDTVVLSDMSAWDSVDRVRLK